MIYTEQSSLSTPDTNEPETLADMPATLTPQEVVVTRTMIIPGREAPLRTSSDKPLHWQQYITRLLQQIRHRARPTYAAGELVLVEPPERSDDRPFVGQSSMRLRMALLGLKYPVGSFSDAEISKVTLEPSRHWMSREPHKPYRVVEAAVSQFTSTVRKIFAPPQHTPRNEQTVSIPVGDD